MTFWEYKTLHLDADVDLDEEQERLDKYGRAGWELVSVVVLSDGCHYAYFKRKTTRRKTRERISEPPPRKGKRSSR
jgi:hypothetical protein